MFINLYCLSELMCFVYEKMLKCYVFFLVMYIFLFSSDYCIGKGKIREFGQDYLVQLED